MAKEGSAVKNVTTTNDRNLLLRFQPQTAENFYSPRPSTRLRGPPATTGAANRPGLVLLSRQYPITSNYVNPT